MRRTTYHIRVSKEKAAVQNRRSNGAKSPIQGRGVIHRHGGREKEAIRSYELFDIPHCSALLPGRIVRDGDVYQHRPVRCWDGLGWHDELTIYM